MYKRLGAVMFPILAILLIGSVVWGYQENREKNSILIKAENQYQRAFHDLSFHIDNLHTELGNALAVNSTSQGFHRKCLINAWKITSQAQNEISQLPLSLIEFHKTEQFLSNIARFSYQTAVRDLDKEPMSPKEMETLMTLYKHSDEISKDLRDVQSKVLSEGLRWMDVEVAMASENMDTDSSIVNGFNSLNQKIGEYSEVDWGPSVPDRMEHRKFQALSGQNQSPEQISKKAAQFLGLPNAQNLNVIENGTDTEFASYSVVLDRPDEQRSIKMDYTKKAGKLIWFMDDREVNETRITLNQAIDNALEFLKDHDYDSMRAVNVDQYNNLANITFATVQDEVIIYPEKLSIRVAMDNGEITGMQASDYIFEHRKRSLKEPQLTVEEAKKRLNPTFQIQSHTLALVDNELNQEVICHQFVGEINGNHYRIYINGDSGLEEHIEQFDI